MAIGSLIAVGVIWWHRRGATDARLRLVDRLVVGSAALIVPVWFELLRNHSQLHSWFTYRSLPLAFGIVMAAAVVPLRPQDGMSVMTPLIQRPTLLRSIALESREPESIRPEASPREE